MKPVLWLSLFSVFLALNGCSAISSTIQPTEVVQIPSPTYFPAIDTVGPTSAQIPAAHDTSSPKATLTQFATLGPKSVEETVQPLLQDPMNCTAPCFWGITPRKTSMDEARAFFRPLGFRHREGIDPNSGRIFYSVGYEDSIGRDSGVTFYASDNLVENIEITPEITRQKAGSPREWISYSPETLIQRFGKPSRVEFALELGQVNITLNMIMYFDTINLIALYSGYEDANAFSSQLCPFDFPFDHVHLLMGVNSPNSPQFPTISLEKATSLTVDQFTQLMLGDPQLACFTLKGDMFHQ